MAQQFTIDADIPMTSRNSHLLDNPGRPRKYPFDKMQLGNSFFMAGDNAAHLLGTAAASYAKRNGPNRQFATRTVTENGILGGRVWCVADYTNLTEKEHT